MLEITNPRTLRDVLNELGADALNTKKELYKFEVNYYYELDDLIGYIREFEADKKEAVAYIEQLEQIDELEIEAYCAQLKINPNTWYAYQAFELAELAGL